jgi:GNAT superfamily N-acetyltransferase
LRQALQRERTEVPGEWPDDPLAQVQALGKEIRRLRAASQRADDGPERPGKKARGTIPEIKAPKDCSDAEVAAFSCLVRQGGEVESKGLERRVRAARALAFLYVKDGALAGVAALKRPTTKHRDDVFGSAGTPEERAPYSLELGWVFVAEDHRGKGYSRALAQAALRYAAEAPMFATTREDNGRMQTTLSRLGFQRLGNAWKSARGNYNLVLFVLTQQPATGSSLA